MFILFYLKEPANKGDFGGEAVAGFPLPPLNLAYS